LVGWVIFVIFKLQKVNFLGIQSIECNKLIDIMILGLKKFEQDS